MFRTIRLGDASYIICDFCMMPQAAKFQDPTPPRLRVRSCPPHHGKTVSTGETPIPECSPHGTVGAAFPPTAPTSALVGNRFA